MYIRGSDRCRCYFPDFGLVIRHSKFRGYSVILKLRMTSKAALIIFSI
jgi:hypothetical protein